MLSTGIKDQLVSAAVASFMPKDLVEENLGKSVLGNIVTQSVGAIATSSNQITFGQVEGLERLKALGYDETSDAARNLVANSNAIQAVLTKVANKMGEIV